MFEKLRQLLQQRASVSSAHDEDVSVAQAAAMLLLEVAWADHEIEAAELDAMRHALKSLYHMEDTAIDALIREARADHDASTGLFPFTRTLNDALDLTEKTALLTELWRLTGFSGARHHYEEHAIRRIADLLYLSHDDFIAAKLEARKLQRGAAGSADQGEGERQHPQGDGSHGVRKRS